MPGGTCQLQRKCTSHHYQQGRGEHWLLFSRTHSSPHPRNIWEVNTHRYYILEPTNIIIDELHLLLRIGDVLLRHVILQADNLDRRSAMTRQQPQQKYIAHSRVWYANVSSPSPSLRYFVCVPMSVLVCVCLNACVCIHVCMHVHGL